MDKDRSSFGVELEFIIAYVPELEAEATDGKAIVIPPHIPDYEADMYVFQHVKDTISTLISPIANTRVFTKDGPTRPERIYQSWHAKADYSIDHLPGGRKIPGRYDGVQWIGIEVTSPALWNIPESFDEVRRVTKALKATYQVVVSEACGLHFHVGKGPDRLSLDHLRRAAALFFAVDPILAQLHPAHRLTNAMCMSIRLFSRVSQGLTAAQVRLTRASAPSSDGAPEITDTAGCCDQEMANTILLDVVDARHLAAFQRLIPYGALQGYPARPGQAHVCPETVVPRSILDCARELLSASQHEVVSTLLECPDRLECRMAYNFAFYDQYKLADPDTKTTLEFRQPAASLDADEIIAFARLYINLFEFAVEAPFENVWSVIQKCDAVDESQPGQGSFDVFDLLATIGLLDEAHALQQIMIQRQAT